MTNIQDNDEAFLNLLSSQRQLLCQLKMESAVRGEQQANAFQAPACGRGSIIGGLDPMSMMNRPIIERRGSMDFLLAARRLSLGMSGDLTGSSMPNIFIEHDDLNLKPSWDVASLASKSTKRRRSSLGLLGSMIVDDQQQSRRLSLLSNFSKTYDNEVDKIVREEVFGAEKFLPPNPGISRNSSLKPNQLKVQMEAFALAMEKSSKSQQDIHDWDRKMGLKRSHSKTMRMTMRSRKKLRTLIKREMNSISHGSKPRC